MAFWRWFPWWRCAVAPGCPRCTQWHSVGQGGSPCTRRHAHSVFSGALALGGTQPFSVLRAGGRARAQWCLCRSAASGARRHSVALNGARARGGTNRGTRRRFAAHGGARRPRWNAVACGRWHRAVTPLGGARRRSAAHGGTQRHSVEAVACGRRHRAVTPHGGARWRANVCTLWHSVASGGARRPALACVAVSAHLKSAGWLLQRSSADQR